MGLWYFFEPLAAQLVWISYRLWTVYKKHVVAGFSPRSDAQARIILSRIGRGLKPATTRSHQMRRASDSRASRGDVAGGGMMSRAAGLPKHCQGFGKSTGSEGSAVNMQRA